MVERLKVVICVECHCLKDVAILGDMIMITIVVVGEEDNGEEVATMFVGFVDHRFVCGV